jgi:hypothetical protein
MIFAFLLTAGLKILPVYMEAASLNNALERLVDDNAFKGKSSGEIRSKIAGVMNMNRIEGIHPKDVKITRTKKGTTIIDATYDTRMNFMSNIDVVVKNEKLIYEFQSD